MCVCVCVGVASICEQRRIKLYNIKHNAVSVNSIKKHEITSKYQQMVMY